MPKFILTIHRINENDEDEIVRCDIGEIDPMDATLTVITALRNSQPKKRRSDAGVPRKPQTEVPSNGV